MIKIKHLSVIKLKKYLCFRLEKIKVYDIYYRQAIGFITKTKK